MGTRAMRLDVYLADAASRRFHWARHNCCHFVAAWVAAETGRDPMEGLPWTHGRAAALRLIRQLGGTLADAWTRQLGRAPIAATLAQPGDVVLVPLGPASAAVGLCTGSHAALLTEHDGLIHLPMSAATQAWRVAVP